MTDHNKPLFPLWQVDQQEYQAICTYLDLSPKPYIYKKLSDYLVMAPFRFTRPKGFSQFLAKPRLTKFRIARLDLTSKLFFPNHPIRQILNGVIALYECDGEGYSQISAAPTGWHASLSLLGWAAGFALSLAITAGWLCWHYLLYFASSPLRSQQDLTGKQILITGVSKGLGLDLLLFALQQGAKVIGTVRNRESFEKLRVQLPEGAPLQLLAADLSQPGALVSALQENDTKADAIDIAILCAGTKYSGASVLTGPCLRDTFEVNCFSSIDFAEWLYRPDHNAALVLISSIGRWHGMHSSCGYNASKAALSIWGESLEMERHQSGNRSPNIMIVEPGIFESGMMERKGILKYLFASRRNLSERIISGALSGKRVLRYPFWFALLTWTVCLGGRKLRCYLFARAGK